MRQPLPGNEPASAAPCRIRITAEIVVEVVDETALRQAAAERADEVNASDGRDGEQVVVRPGNAGAVAFLADPDAVADSIPGVEVVEASWHADIAVPGEAGEQAPDFAALLPIRHAADSDGPHDAWQLTPRTAAVLYRSLSMLAEDAYEDIERHGGDPVTDNGDWDLFDRLPRLSWHEGIPWRRQAARSFDDLASDLSEGRWPLPRCNAEELALHLAIDVVPAVLDTGVAETELPGLLEHPDDEDWDMCSEVLFQDHDILLLNDPAVDGIENPANALNRDLGIGDLRPCNWFRLFRNVEPRDLQRGFRQ